MSPESIGETGTIRGFQGCSCSNVYRVKFNLAANHSNLRQATFHELDLPTHLISLVLEPSDRAR
jgi:hypothetical protein